MNIIISGLTAAGKTTHCKLLVSELEYLGYEYLSASVHLLKKYGKQANKEAKPLDYWISDEALALNEQRTRDPSIDRELDQELAQIIDSGKKPYVVDVLSAPWLSRAPAIRIWLESSLESRTMKATVSYRGTGRYPPEEVRTRIQIKDSHNRIYFANVYQFDFFLDKNPFDVIIDLSSLITEPTEVAAARSIAAAQPVLSSLIRWKLGLPGGVSSFAKCMRDVPTTVFNRVPETLLNEVNAYTE